MPFAAPPLPIKISSREDDGIVFWEVKPQIATDTRVKEQVLFTTDTDVLKEFPWLFDQLNLLAYRIGQVKLEQLGYVAAVQVAPAVEPQPTSTIIVETGSKPKGNH